MGGIVGGIVGSVASGLIGADAADSAADAQRQAVADSNALQRETRDMVFEQQRPYREAGTASLNRMAYLLGLSPTGYGGASPLPTVEEEAAIRARLLPKFTPAGTPAPTPTAPWGVQGPGTQYDNFGQPIPGAAPPKVDESGLQRAIQLEIDKQERARDMALRNATRTANRDPNYGSLLDTFGMDDFQADPGYDFRMDEGMQALERSAAARGRLLSGGAIKDTLRFSQGLASDEYGRAYDRFRLNQGDKFNRLASVAGIGQTATNQTSSAAQRYGETVGGNMIGAGNAIAAGRVGSANAINGAIGQGVSLYQQNAMMNSLQPSPAGNPINPNAYGFDGSNGAWWN
jgi:hypothetical protein